MKIHIITTCSQRKKISPSTDLQLGSLESIQLRDRCGEWISKLKKLPSEILRADELYQGEHWSVGIQLLNVSEESGFKPCLWVCSAGYGLIKHDAPIKPYAATFTKGEKDSVGDSPLEWQDWWDMLSDWDGPVPNAPRTISELVVSEPDALFLIVASKVYLQAIKVDVEESLGELESQSNLMLLSAGTSRLGILTDYLLPANARLQNLVGGASQALNVRIARWLLQQTTSENLCFDHAEALLQKAIEQQPQITRRSGKPITDEEAISYIQEALEQNGKAAHTPLLRRLRKEGYACEQKRFKALFNQAKQDWQESSEPQNLELFGGLHGKLMEGGAK